MPVTFLTVLPLTQLIVLFDLLAPEPGFAGVVAVVDEPEEDPCVSFAAKMKPPIEGLKSPAQRIMSPFLSKKISGSLPVAFLKFGESDERSNCIGLENVKPSLLDA